jgi:peptidoglycan/LPS O-acetylase OafA/YrhL
MRANRVTERIQNSYLPSLQVLRAIAALAVVCYHACLFVERETGQVLFGGWYHLGELGVDFFFVLSGFIIAHVHGHELGLPNCAPRYLKRRFFRIYPLLFVLTSLRLLAELPQWLKGIKVPDWERLFSSYLLMPQSNGTMPIISAAWTLQHEALFYGLFLLALLLGRRVGTLLMMGWLLLVIVVGVFGLDLHGLPRLLCDAHNVEFMFGVLVCESLHQRVMVPSRLLVWGILLAGMIFGVACYEPSLGMDQKLITRLMLGGGFAALIWLLAGHEMKRGAMLWPAWLRWIGDASYSIYLAHSVVLLMVVAILSHLIHGSLAYAYGVAGASVIAGLLAGSLVWLLIERRLLIRSREFCR